MPKFQVSYLIAGRADRQYLVYEHPTDMIDPTDVIRAIVKHEFPKNPDPFPATQHTTREQVLDRYNLSELKYVSGATEADNVP